MIISLLPCKISIGYRNNLRQVQGPVLFETIAALQIYLLNFSVIQQ